MYYLKFLLLWLLTGFPTLCSAQEALEAYNQFKHFRLLNKDSALYYAEKALHTSIQEGDALLSVRSGNAAGWILTEIGEYRKAATYYIKAYQLAKRENFSDQLIYISNNLGLNFYRRGIYDESLKYHLQSLELREEKGDQRQIGVAMNNLGLVYYKLKQYEHALKFFRESLAIDLDHGNTEQVYRSYINIGLCEIEKGNYNEALKLFDQVISSCNDCPDDILVQTYSGLGAAFLSMDVESMAIKNFEISESYASKLNYSSGTIVNNHYLSLINLRNKNFSVARDYLNKSIEAASELKSTLWLKNNYLVLSKLEESTGDFEEALAYHKSYTQMQDSLINEQVIQNIQSLQHAYNDRKYQQYLASMDLRLAEQNRMNTLLGAMVFLISIVGLVLYNSNKNRKRATRLISKAYIEVERQKNRLETAVVERTAALNKSNQDLNNFIYKTSHDIRGPLATLKGICNIALLDVNDPIAVKYFNKLELTSDHLIDVLGRIQNINHIKNYKLVRSCLNIHHLVTGIIDELDDELKQNILCNVAIPQDQLLSSDPNLLKIVLKNIIHNAFKFSRNQYSEPSFVSITFHQDNHAYNINITDNGFGIEQREMSKIFDLFYKYDMKIGSRNSAGIGLHLAEMAVKKLNGRIEVESTPMVETTFTISLPLKDNLDEDV
jgi:signal transduction histidine kinase/Tfp pilus assembly protein PilF